MTVRFLGTGTTDGVPVIGCDCAVCRLKNPKNQRLRSGVFVEQGGDRLLIETSPDLRFQALKYHITHFDAILLSHAHYDHSAGLPEIRRFNFIMNKTLPLYANAPTLEELTRSYYYFFEPIQEGGGLPSITFNKADKPFMVKSFAITPIPIKHGVMDILGYRIGAMAFITDASFIPETSFSLLENLDLLILNALRYEPHSTHFSVGEAVKAAQKIAAKQTYFTHMAHNIDYDTLKKELPPTISPAYDGLKLEI
jgi:phosphoribosyl 1,2-cyclic phosphate phosphodiesterase